MVHATRGIGKMVFNMAEVSILGPMDNFMRVIGKMTKNMVKAQ